MDKRQVDLMKKIAEEATNVLAYGAMGDDRIVDRVGYALNIIKDLISFMEKDREKQRG